MPNSEMPVPSGADTVPPKPADTPSPSAIPEPAAYPADKVDLVSTGAHPGSGGFMDKIKAYMSEKRNRYFVYITGVLFIAILCAFTVWYFQDSGEEEQLFSDAETLEILTGIVENNPKGVLAEYDGANPNTLGATTYSGDIEEDDGAVALDPGAPTTNSPIPSPVVPDVGDVQPAEEDIIPPDLNVYNYRHTETEYRPGPAYEACYGSTWAPVYKVSEYKEFFDLDRTYYLSETVNQDTNHLMGYHLGKYGTDINEYYAYRGGDFAARILDEIHPDFSNEWRLNPVSYPYEGVPVSERVEMYFGSDAEITDIFEVDGVLYYEITATSMWNCYGGDHTTIWIYTVRADSFAIERKRAFLDTLESLSNLISDMTVTREVEKVTRDQVENEFVFDKVDNVVDVDYQNYVYDPDAEYDRFVDHVAENDYNLIVAPLDEFDIYSISGKDLPERVDNERYYLKRLFYADDGAGQDEYEQVISNYINRPEISAMFREEARNEFLDIGLYSSSKDPKVLLEDRTKYTSTWNLDWGMVPVSVDDDAVTAYKATVKNEVWYNSPVSYAVSLPPSYPKVMPTSYGTYYVYPYYWTMLGFRYMSYPYIIDHYGMESDYLEGISYEYVAVEDIDQSELSDVLESYFTFSGYWW